MRTRRPISALFYALAILVLGACSGPADPGEFQPLDFEEFIDGKADTGYLSNKAAELEARLTSRIYIDMSGQAAEAIQAEAERLRTASRWTLQSHTSPQLKYARNPLKSEKLDLNLERGDPEVLSVSTDANGVWLDYATAIESLVKFKELEEKGLTPADLVGKQVEFLLPAVPTTAFSKGGIACATDPDGDELHAEDLRDDNYFYYFDPEKDGCPLQRGTDLVEAHYEVISSLDAPSVFPEYDLLTADKKISMVALFGQITHGDLESNDLGWIAYREFKRDMEREGFSRTREFENGFGEQLEKTYAGGLEVTVDFYNPEALKDHRPRDEVNELFMQAIHDHELVYYNGHAFYGSLTVLDRPEAYPTDTYQVIFMDACWSYAYYTKQVFEHKTSESDADGMKYADVVNNTEPGITGSHETAWLLYQNLFKACSEWMQGRAPSKYSWNNLIVYMNDSADRRARWYDPEEFHAEIYGASGVTANCFNPTGRSYCEQGGSSSRTHSYDDAVELPIPDDDTAGLSRSLQVPDSFAIASAAVKIDIQHTYIGDLVVKLSHGGTERILHDRSGGGSDDLRTTVSLEGFDGMDAAGEWTLSVADCAGYDTGKLLSWGLELTEEGGGQDVIQGEDTGSHAIPDNDANGVQGTISISDSSIAGEVEVQVRIQHSYVGDLRIQLEHAGVEVDLRKQEGGSAQDIDESYSSQAFAGQSAAGDWVLTVSDLAEADTGTLEYWALTIHPR
ncbi:MAG: proprotein convertase P-domain-containing protein [Deltaproteobacteria bacterium]|nr:proprotein convertase P-domain-containing protein [Deltaproteobacteria bacterium]